MEKKLGPISPFLFQIHPGYRSTARYRYEFIGTSSLRGAWQGTGCFVFVCFFVFLSVSNNLCKAICLYC